DQAARLADAMKDIRIIGSYLSPYVRKVLACLHLKGLGYEIDPIVPFFGDDRFTAVSPLRRVPVLIDDRVTLADSSVICQYLEDRYPSPPLYPAEIGERARARWLEEYADSRIGDVFIWGLFDRAVIAPAVWGTPRDRQAIERVKREEIPPILDYLESQLPSEGFLWQTPGVADIAIAVFFRNAAFARYQVDPLRWPAVAGFVDRVLALPCLAQLQHFESVMLRTAIPGQRAALLAAGAPVSAETLGTAIPRPGTLRSR
ncbi:MAG TPA: glutathione S-transferase family protein, partial [Steroidobacteraceae bacterium]|nr:glutathione S-transferase family protein [Steroidobacteraceae bacterium]